MASLFATVAVKLSLLPTSTDGALGEMFTDSAADVTTIVAAADFLGSATEVATITSTFDVGKLAGAMNVTGVPDALAGAENVPQDTLAQSMPFTLQFTPSF